jgi:hypothetical protein
MLALTLVVHTTVQAGSTGHRCEHTCNMALGAPSLISLSKSDLPSPPSSASLLLITGGSCLWSPTSTTRWLPFMMGIRASGLHVHAKQASNQVRKPESYGLQQRCSLQMSPVMLKCKTDYAGQALAHVATPAPVRCSKCSDWCSNRGHSNRLLQGGHEAACI